MALTGPPDGEPLAPPAGLVPRLDTVADLLTERSTALGGPVTVDPLDLVTERAALADLGRGGQVSCGGATRLLETRDGWLAVSLARPDDAELVPAWLRDRGPDDLPGAGPGTPLEAGDHSGWRLAPAGWDAVARSVRGAGTDELVEQGVLLGLPVAALPEEAVMAPSAPAPLAPLPLTAHRLADASGLTASELTGLTVVDLSSLWAGPLCGSLLVAAGADVIKVESSHRPDGARRGPPAFFDLMNAGKRSVALDLRTAEGRRALRSLVRRADVVIEASRPRALEQLGIDALEHPAGPRVWVSITGHGRAGEGRDRVAFGDDAAVAGGLVSWDTGGGDGPRPCFCADAVADPVTGLVAAAAALDALAVGGRWLLDVAMVGVAAHLADPTVPSGEAAEAAAPKGEVPPGEPPPPRARRRPCGGGRAAALGADTAAVLSRVAGP